MYTSPEGFRITTRRRLDRAKRCNDLEIIRRTRGIIILRRAMTELSKRFQAYLGNKGRRHGLNGAKPKQNRQKPSREPWPIPEITIPCKTTLGYKPCIIVIAVDRDKCISCSTHMNIMYSNVADKLSYD